MCAVVLKDTDTGVLTGNSGRIALIAGGERGSRKCHQHLIYNINHRQSSISNRSIGFDSSVYAYSIQCTNIRTYIFTGTCGALLSQEIRIFFPHFFYWTGIFSFAVRSLYGSYIEGLTNNKCGFLSRIYSMHSVIADTTKYNYHTYST
jgi:hypothetical protein